MHTSLYCTEIEPATSSVKGEYPYHYSKSPDKNNKSLNFIITFHEEVDGESVGSGFSRRVRSLSPLSGWNAV
jgi:hypothetical protein